MKQAIKMQGDMTAHELKRGFTEEAIWFPRMVGLIQNTPH